MADKNIPTKIWNAVEEFGEDIIQGVSRLTKAHFPIRESKHPLKRSLTGYEMEFFVLDSTGNTTDATPLIEVATAAGLPIVKEVQSDVIEVLCLPGRQLRRTSEAFVETLVELSNLADGLGLYIYPFGTYPGKATRTISPTVRYNALKKALGEKYLLAGMNCCGYHQHYTLPKGVFDKKNKRLKNITNSKVRRTLLDSYNFIIAADPALTCILQSSPFHNGKFIAKDSRMFFFRDGHTFDWEDCEFYEFPMLGELPPYEHTLHGLKDTISQRADLWRSVAAERAPELEIKKTERLSYFWGPLKINAVGTLEFRGCDSNYLTNVLAVATIMKFALRRIQQDFLLVTEADIAIEDAFTVEGNILFIPPQEVVRKELQRASAIEGLQSKRLHIYVSRLYRFAYGEVKRFEPTYLPLLKPVERMLKTKKTVSDELIAQAKRMGCTDTLTQPVARKLALKHAKLFRKDLIECLQVLEDVHRS